jgi:hypothetical protein
MHILWIAMFLVLYMLLTCKPLRPASFMYTLWIVMSSPASFMHILWVVVFVVLYMFFDPEAIRPQSVMHILWVVMCIVLYMFLTRKPFGPRKLYAYSLDSDVSCCIHAFDLQTIKACFIYVYALARKPLGPDLFMHILWVVMCIVVYMFLTRKPLGPHMLYAYPLDSDVSCSIHAFDLQTIKACFIYVYPLDSDFKPASFMHILWVVVFVVLYTFLTRKPFGPDLFMHNPLGSDVHCSIHVFDQKAVGAPHALCISSG